MHCQAGICAHVEGVDESALLIVAEGDSGRLGGVAVSQSGLVGAAGVDLPGG
jgi:hypothetical protein